MRRKLIVTAVGVMLVSSVLYLQVQAEKYRATLELPDALKRRDVRRIRQLVERGADPNGREVPPQRPVPKSFIEYLKLMLFPKTLGDGEGATPLIVAARAGNLHLVRLLIERGASVKASTEFGI